MTRQTTKSPFLMGCRDSAPFVLVVAPLALLFGVVATEAGLNVFEALTFSFMVIAGAAQLTALQLMVDQAPVLVILTTALAVNMRMAMYSASLTPHLGAAPLWHRALAAYFIVDQSYGLSVLKFDQEPDWTLRQKLAYFWGTVAPVCPFWYIFTLVGAMIGAPIPEEFALDFALPICFLAIITPMLRTRAHLAAALVSIALALIFAWLPYNLGLLIAGIAGMMTGAEVERRTEVAS